MRWTILLAAMLVCACAATGVKVAPEALDSLQPGSTLLSEVLAKFGPPTSRIRNADGTEMLQYVYAESQIKAASFVPIVGLFAGGSEIRSTVAMLRFDRGGKLLDVSSAESQYGTGVGAAAGAVDTKPIQQPRQ